MHNAEADSDQDSERTAPLMDDRSNRIAEQLDRLEKDGTISWWYCYSPDGRKRWTVGGHYSNAEIFSTGEIERAVAVFAE